jgi:methionine aminotransferase
VLVHGGVPVVSRLDPVTFSINWQDVKSKVTPRTRALIINSPHNPTGAVLSENDMHELSRLVADKNIFIISDEVYEHLIFDNVAHQSILKYPELFQRSFVCFSFGKVYNCTGWKLGYCVAPPELTREFRKVHQFNCFTCNTPMQSALAKFLKNRDAYLSLSGFMQQKRDHFINLMQDTKFDLLKSGGSYFICAGYDRISDEADKEFAVRLTKEAGVATIPVSSFYHNGKDDKVLRFCFSKKNETLEAAVERLIKL